MNEIDSLECNKCHSYNINNEFCLCKECFNKALAEEKERIINKLIDIAENESIGECIEYIYKLKEAREE